MAKGDIYYLIDSNDCPVAKFEQTEEFMSGNCYQCFSWTSDEDGNYTVPSEWSFFANVYCKWDSCTHWYFYGENYIEDTPADSYYHLCGAHCFTDYIRTMCFIWKIAPMILAEDTDFKDVSDYTNEVYFETDEIKQLIELMLKDYTIKIEINLHLEDLKDDKT